MIYVHQTVNRYGKLEPGLKTTHHVRDRDRRGRWTLFPSSLIAMVETVPADIEGAALPFPARLLLGPAELLPQRLGAGAGRVGH
jgi:hypothetical protein